MCLPRFDSPACFAALLGTEEHGHWQICPTGDYEVSRRYVGASAVVETTFTTATGVVQLLDVMPVQDGRADLLRRITGIKGSVEVSHTWVVRADYGKVRPWVRRQQVAGQEVIMATAGPDRLVLRGPRLPRGDRPPARRRVHRRRGRRAQLLHHLVPLARRGPGRAQPRRPDRPHHRARRGQWAAQCRVDVPHPDVVVRSLVTLRLLTHEQTGGHRRRADHVAARGLRRRAQLGLPLLLAARRRADARVAGHRRLHRGGLAVAQLVAARGRRRPRGPAGDVHRRRRPPAARADPRPPARLRGLAAGAGRQRRGRPAPDGRARRGDGRARRRRAGPGCRGRRRRVAAAAGPGRRPRQELAAARQRDLGDPRPAAALHPLAGDGVGGLRPRHPGRRGERPGGAAGALARGPRRRARGDPRQGLRPRARHVHPALRHPRGGRLAAGAAAGRLRRRRRPDDARHHRGHRGRT